MARIPKTSYFQTPDWVLAWWETIGGMPATELALWRNSSGSLEGIQFLSHILRRVHSRLPPAWPIWTVTGSGVGDADHIGWPVLPEYQETARTYAMRRTRGSTLLLPDLDPETGVPFVPPGARMLFRNPCPRVALYRPDAIPASMRRTQHHLRRYEKRADAAGITFRWIPNSQMDDAFVERFLELHKLRMAEKGVSSRFLSTEALLRRLIAHGSAERGPIAMVAEQSHHMVGLLCFLRWGDTLAFYQSGWSPELASVEIGKLLFNESIKDAGADGMRTLDLLRGTRTTSIVLAPSIVGMKRGSGPEACRVRSSTSSCRPIGSRRGECGRARHRKRRDGPSTSGGRNRLARKMSTAACAAPAQLSEAYSSPARWDFARSPAATGRLRMTYGIALGSKRCRLLSISVISPTAESVWIPSGNGPSENGSTAAAGSSLNSVGVKRRTRLITIPPPYIRELPWAGRYKVTRWP